jgi:hypothetical protein
MHFAFLVSLAFLCRAGRDGDAKPTAPLPPLWHGTWSGKLAITGPKDEPSDVAIALRIEPIKGTDNVTWAITYGQGDKKIARDYKLVACKKPGRFQIDEGNGVALDARLVNGVLYSQFEVGGSLLAARYEIRGDILCFEITSAKLAAGETGNAKPRAYNVDIVQTAELKRK